jgi:hypothetical protein
MHHKVKNIFAIHDPLSEQNLKQEIKTKLNFTCSYGTKHIEDADKCAINCINYIKKIIKIK